uniref:Uncharacterized protein n=1 Tax=Eutreptiella gymnastica TaxID=73025 RepID=A0A7S1ICF9_9EUGL
MYVSSIGKCSWTFLPLGAFPLSPSKITSWGKNLEHLAKRGRQFDCSALRGQPCLPIRSELPHDSAMELRHPHLPWDVHLGVMLRMLRVAGCKLPVHQTMTA